jgi:plasmid stabilization system protein ParE
MALQTLLWSPACAEKLQLIGEYYAAEDQEQAVRGVRTLLALGRRIQAAPEAGQPVPGLPRAYRVVSTRPFPFLIYYYFNQQAGQGIVFDIRHRSTRRLEPASRQRRVPPAAPEPGTA